MSSSTESKLANVGGRECQTSRRINGKDGASRRSVKQKRRQGRLPRTRNWRPRGALIKLKARPKKSKARLRNWLGISKTRPVGNLSNTAGTALPPFRYHDMKGGIYHGSNTSVSLNRYPGG